MKKYYYQKRQLTRRKLARVFGIFLFAFGVITAGYMFFPVISWQIFFSSFENSLTSPIPKTGILTPSLISTLVKESAFGQSFDSSDAKSWFPKVNLGKNSPKVTSYLLTIPKLHINNALVATTDYNIDKHLINYGGTAIPADSGNAVIIGHSTLPQLFDPKNYKTIFANAYQLQTGDQIIATLGNVAYSYKIESIRIVDPDDTSAFAQWYDNSYITIITCTPPGTIWKRLIVKAVLQKI